jgi:UDP-2-acetamido-3-amino-2,3-dideoxy-glucuronate N-acetyltransferase
MNYSLINFEVKRDPRGSLLPIEFNDALPFVVTRIFTVADVPEGQVRGAHAHKQCEQLLICLKGKISVFLDDGKSQTTVVLDSPDKGLHIKARVWGEQFGHSDDAVLLVLASDPYSFEDYIFDRNLLHEG